MTANVLHSCFKCASSAFVEIDQKNFLCKSCFTGRIEKRVHKTIARNHLIVNGDRVAVGLSGGKDSVVLLHILRRLKDALGIQVFAVIVDEGIEEYRGEGIKIALSHAESLGIPSRVYSYAALYQSTLDRMVNLKPFGKTSCAICGTFRRKALNLGAKEFAATVLATGHNKDDEAQTILLNLLRGDRKRFSKPLHATKRDGSKFVVKVKPLIDVTQPEVVYYAIANNLEFHDQECPYAHQARRNSIKQFLFEQEKLFHGTITNILRIHESISERESLGDPNLPIGDCEVCGDPTDSVNQVCSGCRFLEEMENLERLPVV